MFISLNSDISIRYVEHNEMSFSEMRLWMNGRFCVSQGGMLDFIWWVNDYIDLEKNLEKNLELDFS